MKRLPALSVCPPRVPKFIATSDMVESDCKPVSPERVAGMCRAGLPRTTESVIRLVRSAMERGRHPKVIRTWTVEQTRLRHQQGQAPRKLSLNPKQGAVRRAPPGPKR